MTTATKKKPKMIKIPETPKAKRNNSGMSLKEFDEISKESPFNKKDIDKMIKSHEKHNWTVPQKL